MTESAATVTSSRIITLFTSQPPARTGPSSILISVLAHGAVLGLMVLAVIHAPRIADRSLSQRYTVRFLNLEKAQPRLRWSPGSGAAQPARDAVARAIRPGGQTSAPANPQQFAMRNPSTRTLVQPDAPPNVELLPNVPIPMVVMWRPESAQTPKLVPPPPQKTLTADVRPSLARPNRESKVADIELSSTAFTSETLPVSASTTSPVSIRLPGVAMIPESAFKSTGQPTPATVMSISDVLAVQGTVALPLVDQTGPVSSSESLVPGRPDGAADGGHGVAPGKQNGSGENSGDSNKSGDQGIEQSAANGTADHHGGEIGSTNASDTGSLTGDPFAVDRIALPRNGQYGVVVVGSSLAEEYPETLGMWVGRLAYTVYLHVGLAKNWILQYSLPRVVEAAGNIARPEAPWPYLIVRPHIVPNDSDSDAILVHGFINPGGHFERLAIVFPPRFAQTKFVLGSLQQWQFRPAMQNGRLTSVEVLLIIPNESE